jgi:hypothetical protein
MFWPRLQGITLREAWPNDGRGYLWDICPYQKPAANDP